MTRKHVQNCLAGVEAQLARLKRRARTEYGRNVCDWPPDVVEKYERLKAREKFWRGQLRQFDVQDLAA